VLGGWKKLHSKELHNLYSSPNIISMIKSRRMRWARHVVCLASFVVLSQHFPGGTGDNHEI
jgi:hypothetical protein